jgi:hypothetical protein
MNEGNFVELWKLLATFRIRNGMNWESIENLVATTTTCLNRTVITTTKTGLVNITTTTTTQ